MRLFSVYKPDDEASKVQRKHVKPVNANDLEDGFLRNNHADDDEDQCVCQIGQCLPKSAKK